MHNTARRCIYIFGIQKIQSHPGKMHNIYEWRKGERKFIGNRRKYMAFFMDFS